MDRESADSVGYAAEMQFMAGEAGRVFELRSQTWQFGCCRTRGLARIRRMKRHPASSARQF